MATSKVPINISTFEELAAVPEVGPATAGLIGLRMASKGITPELYQAIPDLGDSVPADLFDFHPYASHVGETPSPRPGQVSPPRASQPPFRTPPETGPFFTNTPVAGPQAGQASVGAAHAVPYRIPPEEPYPLEYPSDTITFSDKGSWRAFYTKLTAFADERYWSARQRTNQLCMCLEGKSSAFYTMLVHRDPEIEYYDLVHQLQRRFDSREPPEAVQLAFASARQLLDESVADWADRVADLAHRAFHELPDDCHQRQIVLKFCQGCLEKEAGLYAMNSRPIISSIDKALELVRWYRHTRKAMYGRSRLDVRSTSVQFTDVLHTSCGLHQSTGRRQEVYNRDTELMAGCRTHSRAPERPCFPPTSDDSRYRQTALREEVSALQAAVANLSTLPRSMERLAAQVQRLSTRESARSSSPDPTRQTSFGPPPMGQPPSKQRPEGTKEYDSAFPKKPASNWDGFAGMAGLQPGM